MKAILALNGWKRERGNVPEVIDLLIEHLGLRQHYEVPD